MENPKLLPLAILDACEDEAVEGITRMQKLVFLAQREVDDVEENMYEFEPYDYGPFSEDLYGDLDALVENDFVSSYEEKTPGGNDKQVYEITEKGESLLEMYQEALNAQIPVNRIYEIKNEYNRMPLLQMIKRVYDKYPEMAVNSKLNI